MLVLCSSCVPHFGLPTVRGPTRRQVSYPVSRDADSTLASPAIFQDPTSALGWRGKPQAPGACPSSRVHRPPDTYTGSGAKTGKRFPRRFTWPTAHDEPLSFADDPLHFEKAIDPQSAGIDARIHTQAGQSQSTRSDKRDRTEQDRYHLSR